MSYTRKAGPKIQTDLSFPATFFGALQQGDEDEALSLLRAEALPDGEEPSPRAKALIEQGEWDSNQQLSLVLIESNACAGKVGNDDYRFCGKPANFCGIAAHAKNTVGTIRRGWYISLGKAHGILTTPYLPPLEEGGPITGILAGRFMSPNPFRLTKGKWKFVIDAWHASRVVSIASSPTEQNKEEIVFSEEEAVHYPNIQGGAEETKVAIHNVEDEVSLGQLNDQNLSAFVEQNDFEETEMKQYLFVLNKMEAMENQLSALSVENQALRTQVIDGAANLQRYQRAVQESIRSATQEVRTATTAVQVLRARCEDLENALQLRVTTGTPTSETEGVERFQHLQDRVEQLDTAIFGETGKLSQFKESFIEFKEKLESGGGVECNGISFSCYRDFMNWYALQSEPTVSIFLDALAFMHAIRAPVVHTEDAMKQRDLQNKADVVTGLEAAVITSFDTIIPSVLVGSAGRKGENIQGGSFDWLAGYLKSYKVWKPVGTQNGVSHQITNGVSNVTKRVTEIRKRHATPDVNMLSSGLCQSSATFCHELVRFINEQQEELTANTAYSESQIWIMQLECIQRIVEELSEAREGYSDSGRVDRGNYIWGMLMSWKVQQRYLENHFKDDPALTGVLVRRILLQGQDDSVKKQLAKIDVTANQLETFKQNTNGDLRKLKDDIAKLKDEANKAKKQ
jgi:hypothetical protein